MRALRHKPDKDHTFWVYSSEGDGLTFWSTEKERDYYAQDEIRTYLDDNEWLDEVTGVIAGVVTHVATMTDVQRPDGEIDEDGYDESGEGPWESKDQYRCDYKMRPINEPQP
jgi:hypothetical protein